MIINMNPYMMTDGNGQEVVAYYEKVLNAQVISLQTYGDMPENPDFELPEERKHLVIHAHLKVGDTDFMISDSFPGPHQQPYQIGNHLSLAITTNQVETTKEIFTALLKEGNEVVALHETFFSPLYGQVTDRYGVTWHVSTFVSEEANG